MHHYGGPTPEFPRAILHIDGDSFFVSCELARRPDLRGRAAVTGEERGIATAVNPAAKALGVIRGMRTRDIRRTYPEVVILPSDYVMYRLYARRMYAIVRRWAGDDMVEEYSIDECFADLTDAPRRPGPAYGKSYEEIARGIQADLIRFLGITFSVGVGVNKCTAKVASKWQKPAGLTMMPRSAIEDFLRDLPIGKVWGIGRATTLTLRKLGITTALDFARKDRAWVAEHCDRPQAEIWEEFQGAYVKELDLSGGSGSFAGGHAQSSIQHTRTFHPASRDRAFLWSQLSHHIEAACMRLREHRRLATRVHIFLKTSGFEYLRAEVPLADPAAVPDLILREIRPRFEELFRRGRGGQGNRGSRGGIMYRATGISLSGLVDEEGARATLFGTAPVVSKSHRVYSAVDRLARRFGREVVFLGSSFRALKADGDAGQARGEGGFGKKHFDIIYLGEVK